MTKDQKKLLERCLDYVRQTTADNPKPLYQRSIDNVTETNALQIIGSKGLITLIPSGSSKSADSKIRFVPQDWSGKLDKMVMTSKSNKESDEIPDSVSHNVQAIADRELNSSISLLSEKVLAPASLIKYNLQCVLVPEKYKSIWLYGSKIAPVFSAEYAKNTDSCSGIYAMLRADFYPFIESLNREGIGFSGVAIGTLANYVTIRLVSFEHKLVLTMLTCYPEKENARARFKLNGAEESVAILAGGGELIMEKQDLKEKEETMNITLNKNEENTKTTPNLMDVGSLLPKNQEVKESKPAATVSEPKSEVKVEPQPEKKETIKTDTNTEPEIKKDEKQPDDKKQPADALTQLLALEQKVSEFVANAKQIQSALKDIKRELKSEIKGVKQSAEVVALKQELNSTKQRLKRITECLQG